MAPGDLLDVCLSDLNPKDRNVRAFQETFCARCRNRECVHAKWAGDRFGQRVATQADRLLRPTQADPQAPKYAMLADFGNMLEQAMRLEAADRRGDWSVPEIPILDGRTVAAPTETDNAVEVATRQLAAARGGVVGKASESVPIETHPVVPPPSVTPVPQPTAPIPPPTPPTLPPRGNTEMPAGGLMIGGGPPPKTPIRADPWAAPAAKPQRVAPGARIRMGSGESK